MSASNAFETAMLALIFNNSNIADVGDATGLRGSSTAGSVYVALCTADPGEAATGAAMNETVYTNYARMAVVRSAGGWTVSGNSAVNAAAITFPTCGATGATLTHFAIVTSAIGAGTVLFKGALGASLAASNGITPTVAIGAISVAAD